MTKNIAIAKLYDHLNMDIDSVERDIDNGYLSGCLGRDGFAYWWYLDTVKSAAINVLSGEVIDDEDAIDHLFC